MFEFKDFRLTLDCFFTVLEQYPEIIEACRRGCVVRFDDGLRLYSEQSFEEYMERSFFIRAYDGTDFRRNIYRNLTEIEGAEGLYYILMDDYTEDSLREQIKPEFEFKNSGNHVVISRTK